MGEPRHTIRKNFKNKYLLEKKLSVLDVLGQENIHMIFIYFIVFIFPIIINIITIKYLCGSNLIWKLYGYYKKCIIKCFNNKENTVMWISFLIFLFLVLTIIYEIIFIFSFCVYHILKHILKFIYKLYLKWQAILQQRYLPISEQDLKKNNIKTTDDYWTCMKCILQVKNTVFPIFNYEMHNRCKLVYENFFHIHDFDIRYQNIRFFLIKGIEKDI